jgi:uncharacterized protein (TIGR03083 family)
MRPLKPVLVCELFPTLLEELINLLEGLRKEEWAAPTVCGPWSVKDVCLHMLGGDISNLSWKRDGFSVFSEIDSYEHLVQLVNEHNAHWVESTQHFSPRFLIDSLQFTGEQVIDYFQSLDPYALGIPIDWVGPDPAPTWLDLAREYTERWHHQQHIRDAVGKPGLKEARFLAPILDAFILALPRSFQAVEAQTGTVISIHTHGDVSRDWLLVREDDQWRLYEGGPKKTQAAISLPDDIAWRVFTKGIPLEHARQHAKITGHTQLAEKVLETISIIG